MKNKDKIIYGLTIEDVQQVAMQELDGELTKEEIKKLIDPIAENISWFDVIANTINDVIPGNNK